MEINLGCKKKAMNQPGCYKIRKVLIFATKEWDWERGRSIPLGEQPNRHLGEESGAHFTTAFPTTVFISVKQTPTPVPTLGYWMLPSRLGQTVVNVWLPCALQRGHRREHRG